MSSDGRIDMVDLLDMILGLQQVDGITLDSDLDGVVVKTPVDGAEVPEVLLPLTATLLGNATVRFVANATTENPWVEDAGQPAGGRWEGTAISDQVGPVFQSETEDSPYLGVLDLGSFISGVANQQSSLLIYALVNAVRLTQQAHWSYEATNSPDEAVQVTIVEAPAAGQPNALDNDNNGLPDNPFDAINGILPGEIWVATVMVNGVERRVILANLDQSTIGKQGGTVTLSPTSTVNVELPDTQALVAANLVQPGETAIGVVNVLGNGGADDLDGLLDQVDGSHDLADIQAWADAVNALLPGARSASDSLGGLAQFVEISILYTLDSGANYDELEDLSGTGLAATIAMSGIDADAGGDRLGNNVQLWSYPTVVTGVDLYMTNDPDAEKWRLVDADPMASPTSTQLTASTQLLSVFVPANTGIELTGADPATVPQGFSVPMVLQGQLQISAAMSLSQATAAYRIYMGRAPLTVAGVTAANIASFMEGPAAGPGVFPAKQADVAITDKVVVGTNDAANYLYVMSPVLQDTGDIDIIAVDLANPGIQAVLSNAVQAVGTYTVTTTIDPAAATTAGATVTLTPPNGPSLPAGTYLDGTIGVQAQATEPAGWQFDGWTGDVISTANPLALATISANVNLVANFSELPGAGWALTLTPGANGDIIATPGPDLAGNLYSNNMLVTLNAVGNTGYDFSVWGGANVGDLTIIGAPENGVATIVMDADKAISAAFVQVVFTYYTLALDADPAEGGVATAVPAAAQYIEGSIVTVVATPAVGWTFVNWTGADAADLADADLAATTITMDADKQVTANFRLPLRLDALDPNEAWIFGGIAVKMEGAGLSADTRITIDDQPVGGYWLNQDGTELWFTAPAYQDALAVTEATKDVVLRVTDTIDTIGQTLPFTYKQHEVTADANITAFILDDPDAALGNDLPVMANADPQGASLYLPPLQGAGQLTVFGIAKTALVTVAKQNTPVIGALGTGLINAVFDASEDLPPELAHLANLPVGDDIVDSLDFSLHLYASDQLAKNTPSSPGAAVLPGASALIDFGQVVVDSGGIPVTDPATGLPQLAPAMEITFPVNGAFNYGQVANGLMMWGVGTTYDYASGVTELTVPAVIDYQSTLLAAETNPDLILGTSDPAASPNMATARLYSLNGFSLRQGSGLPDDVTSGMRLDTTSGTANDNTANGPTGGGTPLRIVSPRGGLAWVDRVEFRGSANDNLVGTVASAAFTTVPGTTEYALALNAPASSDPSIVDIVIYLKSQSTVALNTPSLNRAYEYVRATTPLDGIILALVGLLVAMLGLAAGGDSGGGGGGPCFIATAAYGTPMAAEIDTLRAVRDTYLLDSAAGTAFVDTYYRISPAIADVVAGSPVLAVAVRLLLVPVIFLGKVALAMPTLTALVGLSIGFAFLRRRRAGSRG